MHERGRKANASSGEDQNALPFPIRPAMDFAKSNARTVLTVTVPPDFSAGNHQCGLGVLGNASHGGWILLPKVKDCALN
jgi:hypothetical protein